MKYFLIFIFAFSIQFASAQTKEQLMHNADSIYTAKNYNEAIKIYGSAIKAGAQAGESYYKIGLCYYYLQNDSLAQKNFDLAESDGYKTAELYTTRGLSRTYSGNTSGAMDDYNKATELQPDYYSAINNRAYLYQKLNLHSQAIADFDHLIFLQPQSATYYARGYSWQMISEFNKAIADYQKAIQLDSSNSNIYVNCGNCYMAQRNITAAISYYNLALQKNPNNALAFYTRGWAYQTNGKPILGCEDLNKAVALGNPNASALLANCGNLPTPGTFSYCMRKGAELSGINAQEEISLCTQAISMYDKGHSAIDSADLPGVYMNRGAAYLAVGDYANSEKDYNYVISKFPKSNAGTYQGGAYFGLGNLFTAKKEYKKAIANYDKAIEISKTIHVPEYYYNNRALAKYYSGDSKGACDDYKIALAGGQIVIPGTVLADLCK
jgi:tetratricopeptide (TPR) repeat protein